MVNNAVSRIFRQVGHNCSDFGHYFMGIQRSNCTGCPDCQCEEGPSIEEAKNEYRRILHSRNFAALHGGYI